MHHRSSTFQLSSLEGVFRHFPSIASSSIAMNSELNLTQSPQRTQRRRGISALPDPKTPVAKICVAKEWGQGNVRNHSLAPIPLLIGLLWLRPCPGSAALRPSRSLHEASCGSYDEPERTEPLFGQRPSAALQTIASPRNRPSAFRWRPVYRTSRASRA